MEIDPRQQWMMIGAEDACAPVPRVLVEPVHKGFRDNTTAIADEEIVQYQPWQGVEGMPPAGKRRRDAEGEARIAQQLPRALVPAPPQVEVGTEDGGVVFDGSDEMLSLQGAPCSTEPFVPRRAARIEMGVYQSEPGAPESDGRRDGYPALQYQGKLDRVRAVEWQGRQDRVPPIALIGAVTHRRSVAQVHAELVRGFHHVFLRPELSDHDPSHLPLLKAWDRRVAAVGFLREHHQRHVRIGAELDIVSVPDPGDDLAQAAPADPDVPTQDHETAMAGSVPTGGSSCEIESNLSTDVAAPRVQAEPLVVMVARQAKIGGVGQ